MKVQLVFIYAVACIVLNTLCFASADFPPKSINSEMSVASVANNNPDDAKAIDESILSSQNSSQVLNYDPNSGEEVNWQVFSNGGISNGSSTNYRMSGTVGQALTGQGVSMSHSLSQGFWQEFSDGGGGCCDFPGDANNNGAVNILDISFTIAYLYTGGPSPVCNDEADANGNNVVNLLDITYSIAYLYQGGPAPICGAMGI